METQMENRAVWLPNLSESGLKRLLAKPYLNEKNVERLRDYEYVLKFDEQGAAMRGLLVEILCSQKGKVYLPKNMFWLSNIRCRLEERLAHD